MPNETGKKRPKRSKRFLPEDRYALRRFIKAQETRTEAAYILGVTTQTLRNMMKNFSAKESTYNTMRQKTAQYRTASNQAS